MKGVNRIEKFINQGMSQKKVKEEGNYGTQGYGENEWNQTNKKTCFLRVGDISLCESLRKTGNYALCH